jgi:RNA polymerase sigma-70 factor (ECF subfamily)
MRQSESRAIVVSDAREDAGELMETVRTPQPDPERQAYAQELHRVLEEAVDTLPETYRVVFMLRDIEGLSTSETSEGLGLGDEAVKTRLHRARAMIRRSVTARLGDAATGAFPFYAPRCDRVVAAVLARIANPSSALTNNAP